MSKEPVFTSFSDYQESTGATAVTEEAVRNFISGKAAADADFHAALVKDPGAVVEAEIGIKMPGGLKLVVHQETNDELHLVLPSPVELSAAQLQTVSGGWPTGAGGDVTMDDAIYDPDGGHDYD